MQHEESDFSRQILSETQAARKKRETAELQVEYGANWEQSKELIELILNSDCLPSSKFYGERRR